MKILFIEPQVETNWHTVFAFGNQVERIRSLQKGFVLLYFVFSF